MDPSDDLGLSTNRISATIKARFLANRKYAKIGTFTILSTETHLPADSREYVQNSQAYLENTEIPKLPPHIHQLACDAFLTMLLQKQDQTILLHGIPGAGKTINRLAISKQLVLLANNGKKKSKVLSGAVKMELALEAFGSYKTAVSGFSSGFGRYTEYQFSSTGRMVGIKLLDYGLNTARVFNGASLNDGERPFQIFYQLLAGCSEEEKQLLSLQDPTSFVYTKGTYTGASQTLTRSSTLTRKLTLSRSKSVTKRTTGQTSPDATPTAEDGIKFNVLKEQLKSLGIGKRTQLQIYKILAAILHLGNLVFQDDENSPQEPCVIKNPEVLATAAELLALPTESLQNAILYKSKTVGKDTFSTFLKQDQASEHRDSLASVLYSQVFTWIIEHLNDRLCKAEQDFDNFIATVEFPWYRTGITNLDGFLANYCQERLIHFTHVQLFDQPGVIFKSEGLNVEIPTYGDNQLSVDVYDGTSRLPGLWGLIDQSKGIEVKLESTPGREVVEVLDSALKPNPSYVPSFDCEWNQVSATGSARPVFGIKHFRGDVKVEYDIESFLEADTVLADFKALFGGNGENETFLMTIFGKKNGVESVKGEKGRSSSTKKVQGPLRRPSMKGKPVTEQVSASVSAPESIQLLLDSIKKTRNWNVFCLRVLEAGIYSDTLVDSQIDMFCLQQLASLRAKTDVDVHSAITYEEFIVKYGNLIATVGGSRVGTLPAEQVQQFIVNRLWPDREIAFGSSMLYLSFDRWQWIYNSMKRLDENEFSPTSEKFYTPSVEEFDSAILNSNRGSAVVREFDTYSEYSDAVSQNESEFQFGDGRKSRIPGSDMEMGNARIKTETNLPIKKEIIQKQEKVTNVRKSWVCCTWLLTWWIPGFFLSCCGKMKRPDIRMAWREKVALCIIIAFMCLSLLFLIIGLRYVICPPVAVLSQDEVRSLKFGRFGGSPKAWFSIYGVYIFAGDLMSSHKKSYGDGTGPGALPNFLFEDLYGTDISRLFYRQDSWNYYCPNFPAPTPGWDNLDQQLSWQRRTGILPQILNVHRSTAEGIPPPLYSDNLYQYAKGKVGWTKESVKALSSDNQIYIMLFDNVYYVTKLLSAGVFPEEVRRLFSSQNQGKDITADWKRARADNPELFDNSLTCINNMFYIGTVDNRNTVQCSVSSALLFGASIVLVAVIGIKFLAALQFGTKKEPEQADKFVILMVPCYTEGHDSLLKTLDSLATFNYDDKRKLLFVICDGMIIGSGNDRPTPRIALDILGVDSSQDPEPLAFHSLGEGNKQYNMGKVYSGLYNVRGHSVPFIVVVKCGGPAERVKPGNRGKRDSQLILMRYLNRVHFNAEFAPLELELYHQMKNVIGVMPSYYEYILMVDADTEAEPESLNRMISVMVENSKIMGLCGETRISNEKDSWVTMIQVYEYFISHHMAKAFESLFGTVTCLPGCFSMYRIRSANKNVPVLVSPGLIADYSENTVDTLHKKNLLHLGEDRYLTTLLLKHFPHLRTMFIGEARCFTVVPDRWAVLLSQRRRWINSTVHNLLELFLLDQLCGFCCFSMRFVVMLDLFATFVQPATILYIIYLIYAVTTSLEVFPVLSLILLAAIYGFQVIIFILKREWQHIMWMVIYICAMPVISFWIPCYSFWHFDDFSWGNTRVVVDDGKKTVYVADTEPFDPKSIPMKRWRDYEEADWDNESMSSGSTFQSKSYVPTEISRPRSDYSMGSVYQRQSQVDKKKFLSIVSFGDAGVNRSIPDAQSRSSVPGPFRGDGVVTDELLYVEIQQALVGADLMTLTKKQIRDNLSVKLGVDLRLKKEVMNRMIDEILAKQM